MLLFGFKKKRNRRAAGRTEPDLHLIKQVEQVTTLVLEVPALPMMEGRTVRYGHRARRPCSEYRLAQARDELSRRLEKSAIVLNISDLIVRNGGSRMDSLGSLNAFVQAAEARSFTIAGRQLGVSSSAIGKAVARMEERLGVRLLHRSTRSITLNLSGSEIMTNSRSP